MGRRADFFFFEKGRTSWNDRYLIWAGQFSEEGRKRIFQIYGIWAVGSENMEIAGHLTGDLVQARLVQHTLPQALSPPSASSSPSRGSGHIRSGCHGQPDAQTALCLPFLFHGPPSSQSGRSACAWLPGLPWAEVKYSWDVSDAAQHLQGGGWGDPIK